MDNKSQSSFHSFDNEDDDLGHDPFVQKPGKQTKNTSMVNPLWSGILTQRTPMIDREHLRNLHEDLKAEGEMMEDAEEYKDTDLPPAFFSDAYEKAHGPLEVSRFKLSQDELRQHATTASAIRRGLIQRSLMLLEVETPQDIQKGRSHSDRKAQLERKYSRAQRGVCPVEQAIVARGVLGRRIYKFRRLRELPISEQMDIVHQAVVQLMSNKDIAGEHQIKPILVSNLVCKLKKNPRAFEEIKAKMSEKEASDTLIKDATEHHLTRHQDIWNADQIKDYIKVHNEKDVNAWRVRAILRSDYGLRYKKLKYIAYLGNSQRSLVLRQRFAMTLLDKLAKGVRVINVDETWINQADFRRRKWRRRGETNSVAMKVIQPRISMLSAIDTDGNLFFALSHGNTDTFTKRLFLSKLAITLDGQSPDWRDNCVVLMDNATYNTSPETQQHMKALNMPYMFTGPYSYDGSPIEKLFALFKSVNINPDGLSTGKKSFLNVVQLVQARMSLISGSTIVRLWHHTVLNLYKFLAFHRL